MTGRQRMLKALAFEEPDRPPHFETMFELEYEAFGVRFPDRHSWRGLTGAAKGRQIAQCMDIYERIVARFEWDALLVFWPWSDPDGVRAAKSTFGDDILIGGVVGGSIWSIESIADWVQFSADLHERPEVLHEEGRRRHERAVGHFEALARIIHDLGPAGGFRVDLLGVSVVRAICSSRASFRSAIGLYRVHFQPEIGPADVLPPGSAFRWPRAMRLLPDPRQHQRPEVLYRAA